MGRWGSWGTGCGCCNSTCGTIAVTVNDQCTGIAIAGASVVVQDAASPPNTVGSCTTARGVITFTLNSGGSGYTNGTGYALGLSGGAPAATGTFDVVLGRVTNLVVTSPGAYASGSPTVTFPGAGPGTGASATPFMGTRCTIPIPAAGTYTVSASATGYPASGTTRSFTCSATNLTINLTNHPASYAITGTLQGCSSGGLWDETITLTGPGGYTATTTTNRDAAGSWSFAGLPGPGTYTAACTANRFQPASGSATLATAAACQTSSASIALTPAIATGYRCTPFCSYPLSLTMTLQDSAYGTTTTITWNPANADWEGTQVVSYPGCAAGSCPARASLTITHVLIDGNGLDPNSAVDAGGCPQDGGAGGFRGLPPTGWVVNSTCPTAAPSSLFTYVGSIPAQGTIYTPSGGASTVQNFLLYCGGTTLTVTEVLP